MLRYPGLLRQSLKFRKIAISQISLYVCDHNSRTKALIKKVNTRVLTNALLYPMYDKYMSVKLLL